MSRIMDPCRPPYGMRLVESPRQCVFAGTVNHSTCLRAEIGGRRFWPIACGRIDVEALGRDRAQLWAEAKTRFDTGAVWWLESTELIRMASDQQIDLYEGDPGEEVLGPWLQPRPSVSISEVLEEWLGTLSRATRITAGMAIPQRGVTIVFSLRSRSVPSRNSEIRSEAPVFPVFRAVGSIRIRADATSATRNRGTLGTIHQIRRLRMEHSGNVTVNRRRTMSSFETREVGTVRNWLEVP